MAGSAAAQARHLTLISVVTGAEQIAAGDSNPETAFWLAKELGRIAEEEQHWRGRLWTQGLPSDLPGCMPHAPRQTGRQGRDICSASQPLAMP